jgi:hypothetical protein
MKIRVSGIVWGGITDYYNEYNKLETLPNTYEMVINSEKLTMDYVKEYMTESIVGFGSESYVVSIEKVEEVMIKIIDITRIVEIFSSDRKSEIK